jgi:RNA-directed DNA polymerase
MELILNPTHSQWLDFLQKQGFKYKQAEKLADYANRLVKSDLPVIFEIEHLSKILGIELALLSRMTGASTLFYRSFEIPKRRSGTRKIHTPYPKLGYVQLWIKEKILDHLPVSEHAYAYAKGRSHIDNARKHIGSKELLKLDISDFFGHINLDAIHQVFFDCGYSESISRTLAGLCSYWGVLPQGAPTSPALSHMLDLKSL